MNTDLFCQFDIRTDTHGHDHDIGIHCSAILETNLLDPLCAFDGLGLRAHDKFHAALLEGAA